MQRRREPVGWRNDGGTSATARVLCPTATAAIGRAKKRGRCFAFRLTSINAKLGPGLLKEPTETSTTQVRFAICTLRPTSLSGLSNQLLMVKLLKSHAIVRTRSSTIVRKRYQQFITLCLRDRIANLVRPSPHCNCAFNRKIGATSDNSLKCPKICVH